MHLKCNKAKLNWTYNGNSCPSAIQCNTVQYNATNTPKHSKLADLMELGSLYRGGKETKERTESEWKGDEERERRRQNHVNRV